MLIRNTEILMTRVCPGLGGGEPLAGSSAGTSALAGDRGRGDQSGSGRSPGGPFPWAVARNRSWGPPDAPHLVGADQDCPSLFWGSPECGRAAAKG